MTKKILYIEDNADNRLLIRRILEAEGYTLSEAPTGKQGLTLAHNSTPNLILVDINLPDIDGYEVTRRLRQMNHLQTTPIIAITANALKGDKEKSLAAGCNSYISKPINVDQLPQQIKAFLP